jgi:signal transduction histidine kinase
LLATPSEMRAHAPKALDPFPGQTYYRWLVSIAGLALVFRLLWAAPWNASIFLTLAFTLFAALLVLFPFYLLGNEFNLLHILILGAGLLYGPIMASSACLFGWMLGILIRTLALPLRLRAHHQPRQFTYSEGAFHLLLQLAALIASLLLFNWREGLAATPGAASLFWPRALGAALLFAGLHGGLFLADAWAGQRLRGAASRREVISLVLLEMLPAPFVLAAALSANQGAIGPLITLGLIPFIVAVLLAANQQLRRTIRGGQEQLQAVLDSVEEGMLVLDNRGQVRMANRSIYTLTRVPAEELVGKSLAELPPRQLARLGYSPGEVQELLPALALGYLPASPKAIVKAPDTEKRILERLASPIWGEDERLIGWIILLRDVSEAYRVAESRELITETMVHDLRSPLSVILGALDMIMDPGADTPQADPETTAEALTIARRSAHRVLSLVESLLEIARLQTGTLETSLVPTSLKTLADTVVGELFPQAQEYGIHLISHIPQDFPLVRADPGKIIRVITNLVDNALKFTPTGGEVQLTAHLSPNHMATVLVSDTGPGIPPEFQHKIFERFTQVPGAHGRRRGSGLGLTFCRLAIEAHGGHIGVEPRPGGGSIFSFTLPLADALPLSKATSSQAHG